MTCIFLTVLSLKWLSGGSASHTAGRHVLRPRMTTRLFGGVCVFDLHQAQVLGTRYFGLYSLRWLMWTSQKKQQKNKQTSMKSHEFQL